MNKPLILYRSKYGASKTYAHMLGEVLGCEPFPLQEYGHAPSEGTGPVIFLAGIYAGGIAGLSQLQKKCRGVDPRRVAVFCVGASPFDERAVKELKARCMKGSWAGVPVFYGRGAWDESKLSPKDRFLCKLLHKAVAKQPPESREPWAQALLSAAGQPHDWTDRAYLEPLLDYLSGFSSTGIHTS